MPEYFKADGTRKFFDSSTWFLIFSNVLMALFAVYDGWDIGLIMLVYWFQSVSIGVVNFVRILQLENFSTENFKINGQAVNPTKITKIFTAFFFLIHYGTFHLVYLVFIFFQFLKWETVKSQAFLFALLGGFIFFLNHLYSYFYNREDDMKKRVNIGSLMTAPYARITPMHLTIIFGSFVSGLALPLFLFLKAGADVVMHIREHKKVPGKVV